MEENKQIRKNKNRWEEKNTISQEVLCQVIVKIQVVGRLYIGAGNERLVVQVAFACPIAQYEKEKEILIKKLRQKM